MIFGELITLLEGRKKIVTTNHVTVDVHILRNNLHFQVIFI